MHWMVMMLSVLQNLFPLKVKLSLCILDLVCWCLDHLWSNFYNVSHQNVYQKQLSLLCFDLSPIICSFVYCKSSNMRLILLILVSSFQFLKISKWLCIWNSKHLQSRYHPIKTIEFEYYVIIESSKCTPKK